MQRPEFEYDRELWRKRNIPSDVFADMYDGKVWKDFQYVNEHPFLASPNNLSFMLNIDWFPGVCMFACDSGLSVTV